MLNVKTLNEKEGKTVLRVIQYPFLGLIIGMSGGFLYGYSFEANFETIWSYGQKGLLFGLVFGLIWGVIAAIWSSRKAKKVPPRPSSEIRTYRLAPCPSCKGSGEKKSLFSTRQCQMCEGYGSILLDEKSQRCSRCGGTGKKRLSKCKQCQGTGWVNRVQA